MILRAQINDQNYRIDLENPLNLAIPLDFSGAQPNAFGVERALAEPCRAGSLIGDTRQGGSCNFERITFIPHCNGTHTECVGHLTHERISVNDCLKDAFVLATVISIKPEKPFETTETYAVQMDENDRLLTREAIEEALENIAGDAKSAIPNLEPGALIVRTLPNDEEKKRRAYMKTLPPFFSTEAMRFIVGRGVKHLLVDVPSIDRSFDEGRLSNHRIFWNIEQGSFEIGNAGLVNNTITEMIYVPDWVEDGVYLLNLQIPAFVADAAPSRPLLFRIL